MGSPYQSKPPGEEEAGAAVASFLLLVLGLLPPAPPAYLDQSKPPGLAPLEGEEDEAPPAYLDLQPQTDTQGT